MEKGRRLSLPFVFYFNACARRVTSRVISTLKSTPLFGPLNFCLFITCIRIRFDGQFREWASTRRCEPLLTSGSWKAVTGYTCGLQESVLSSFQKLQRSLTLTALESTYELVTSLLGWNLSGFNWWHFHSKMVLWRSTQWKHKMVNSPNVTQFTTSGRLGSFFYNNKVTSDALVIHLLKFRGEPNIDKDFDFLELFCSLLSNYRLSKQSLL